MVFSFGAVAVVAADVADAVAVEVAVVVGMTRVALVTVAAVASLMLFAKKLWLMQQVTKTIIT